MSMDALAAEAGVTKPTVYLRYPGGKAQVAAAALAHLRERSAVAETGETRADLVLHLERFRRGVERPYGMAMVGSVLAEEHDTPELLTEFRTNVVGPRRKLLRGILERARDRGELHRDADLDAAVNMAVGAYYAQYLAGEPFTPDWAERTADAVLAGLRDTSTDSMRAR
jgi:AcrR family transcriptional regulator